MRGPICRRRRHASETGVMRMDAATRANLELTRTLSGERAGSLLATIDRTVTPGRRALAQRTSGRTADRYGCHSQTPRCHRIFYGRHRLPGPDPRHTEINARWGPRSGPAGTGRGGPRDLDAVRGMIVVANDLATDLADAVALPDELRLAAQTLSRLDKPTASLLAHALADNLPLLARDGGFIAEGYLPRTSMNCARCAKTAARWWPIAGPLRRRNRRAHLAYQAQ